MPHSADAKYLEPSAVRVLRTEGGFPRAEIEGERIDRVVFRRLFPLSNPTEYIAVQDAAKTELGILKNLEGLDPETRGVIEHELDRLYFTPSVSRIDVLVQESGMWRFEVETDRGPATYYVRNWRDSAHEIGPMRWLVHSVDGQRFEIPKTDELDARSQDLLEQLL